MKKILLSTALLSATAGMAAAEVSFSGYGRFGVNYDSGREEDEVQVFQRLRFNINAKTETDSGVTFGGRIRLQSDSGRSEATLNTAYVYAEYEGFRLEVGNSNAAVDSLDLAFASEIGAGDFSEGGPLFVYEEYQSRSFGSDNNRMGVFASYSVGDFNGRISYIQRDQTDGESSSDEVAVSADYVFGAIKVEAAYADNAGGLEDAQYFFVGAQYSINDVANVGLLYADAQDVVVGSDVITGADIIGDANKVTLYANYTFDAIQIEGYVASLDSDVETEEDVSYGIGVNYDLGGARLSSGILQDFDGETQFDAGVRFDF